MWWWGDISTQERDGKTLYPMTSLSCCFEGGTLSLCLLTLWDSYCSSHVWWDILLLKIGRHLDEEQVLGGIPKTEMLGSDIHRRAGELSRSGNPGEGNKHYGPGQGKDRLYPWGGREGPQLLENRWEQRHWTLFGRGFGDWCSRGRQALQWEASPAVGGKPCSGRHRSQGQHGLAACWW
jgi:hypothetical protein